MFGGSRQRGFVRTEISATERLISVTILILLAGIGTAIYIQGLHFDPTLFALDPSFLEDTQPAQPEIKLYEEAADETESQTRATTHLANIAPKGWTHLGTVESFTAETLYEKINGRAEQYHAYNVADMRFAGYTNQNDFIDVFVYNMGTPLNAFGIYSVERTEGQPSEGFGRESYAVEASYFFWKSTYYIQVIGSSTSASVQQAAHKIARALDNRLIDDNEVLWGLTQLPKSDRIENTIQYFKRDALSLDFLTETFTARYTKGDTEITAFISRHNTPESALSTFNQYKNYLTDYGQLLSPKSQSNAHIITGDMGGIYDIVFQQGIWVGGITMAEDQDTAKHMLSEWLTMFTSSEIDSKNKEN